MACGSEASTADLNTVHMSIATTRTPARHARVVTVNASSHPRWTMSNFKKRNDAAALTDADVMAIQINPFYAIELHEDLFVAHPPSVSEEDWLAANVSIVAEIGAEAFLRKLLPVLKGEFPCA